MATVFPVDVTVERLVEFNGTISAICQQSIGRVPPTGNPVDSVREIMLLMALQGSTGKEMQDWLSAQPEAVAYRLAQSSPPPSPPSRPIDVAALLTFPRRGASLYGQFGDPRWDGEAFARIIADCGMKQTGWWAWGGWTLNDSTLSRMPFHQLPDRRYDLFAWNESYFDAAEQRTRYNNGLGLAVEWTLTDLYSWSYRKAPLPGIGDQSSSPFRANVNGIYWEKDDVLVDKWPAEWVGEFVTRLVTRLKGLGVIWKIGNEMPEKDLHRRIRNIIRAIDPTALVTVSRNVDSPGQYANMAIGTDYDGISFHGWRDMDRLNEVWADEAAAGRPSTYVELLRRPGVEHARITACSDGARVNSSNAPYDFPKLEEAFAYAADRGCNIDHQSQSKMRLFNDGVHELDTLETDFLERLARL